MKYYNNVKVPLLLLLKSIACQLLLKYLLYY